MFRLPWPTRKDVSTPVALALQGGGAHGAYTWGVLDRLLEAGVPIEGISGTSAGAMNAVALAEGWTTGGAEGARAALDRFWTAVGDSVPFHLELLQSLSPSGDGSLPSPMNMMLGLARVFSPYQLNPFELNPLRDVVRAQFDFERIRRACPLKLFIAATAVRTGKVRLFRTAELGEAALLASACLPTLHHAVEIDGEHYWDGGYAANPPVLPLVERTDCADIVIVQVDPVRIKALPTSAQAIRERVQVLAFNAGFLSEMHEVAARGDVRLHVIEAAAAMARLGAASKLDADAAVLQRLLALGRQRTRLFLAKHKDALGKRSSLDVAARFL